MNQSPPAGNSDFMARLQAMRAGKVKSEPAPGRSLKARLEGPPPHGEGDGNKAADIRARIQDKFKKKPLADLPPPDEAPTSAPPPERPSSDVLPENSFKTVLKTEEEVQTWSSENGGSCPECDSYNIASVVFCGKCNYMLRKTVQEKAAAITSYPLKELRGLAHTFINKLAQLNIKTTEDLLRMGLNRNNRQTLLKQSSLSERSLLRLLHQADLCRVPSITPEHAALLELLAITSLSELLQHKPLELYKKIQQAKIKLNQNGILFLPTKTQVNTWLEEAQLLPTLQIL